MSGKTTPTELFEEVGRDFRDRSTRLCQKHGPHHGGAQVLTAMIAESIRHLMAISQEGASEYVRAYVDFADGKITQDQALARMMKASKQIEAGGAVAAHRARRDESAAQSATKDLFSRVMKGSR